MTRMRVVKWNTDKPHRCPDCHTCVVWGESPRWWGVYQCCRCSTVFARFPRTLARFMPMRTGMCDCPDARIRAAHDLRVSLEQMRRGDVLPAVTVKEERKRQRRMRRGR